MPTVAAYLFATPSFPPLPLPLSLSPPSSPPLTTLNSPIQWRGKRAIRIGPLLPLLLQLGAGNVTTPFCIISTLIGPYRPAGVFRGVPSATILSLDVYFLSFFLSLFLSGSFCHIQWRPQRRDPDRILSQGWLRIPGKDHRWPIESYLILKCRVDSYGSNLWTHPSNILLRSSPLPPPAPHPRIRGWWFYRHTDRHGWMYVSMHKRSHLL